MLKFTFTRFAFCRLPDALAVAEKLRRSTVARAGLCGGLVTCANTIGPTTTIASTRIAPPTINSRRSSVCLLIDTVLPWPNSVPDSRGVIVTATHTPAPGHAWNASIIHHSLTISAHAARVAVGFARMVVGIEQRQDPG